MEPALPGKNIVKNLRTTEFGFSLIELIVVILIAGILITIAAPSFKSLTQSQQAKNASFELFSSISLARSEAIKRGANVTLTPTDASDWGRGWTLATATETIRSQAALKGVVITLGPASVVYAKNGRTAAASFQIDVSATATLNVRCIKIELSGMPRSIKGACS